MKEVKTEEGNMKSALMIGIGIVIIGMIDTIEIVKGPERETSVEIVKEAGTETMNVTVTVVENVVVTMKIVTVVAIEVVTVIMKRIGVGMTS